MAIVFQGSAEGSAGIRLLVASFWGAILLLSAVGLFLPRPLAPLLLVQAVYKTLWLVMFVAPLVARQGWSAVPWGLGVSFALIVVSYPWLYWLGTARPRADPLRPART